MMFWEKENNVANLNGSNNKKVLPKESKGTWQYTYNSTSRNVIRMWWLTKFTAHLFMLLSTQPTKSLSTCCNESYNFAFAPNHPYIIQCAAWGAMKCVGTRDWILETMKVTDAEKDLTQISTDFAALRDALTKFLNENNMSKLP